MKILYYGTLEETGTKLCNYLSQKHDVAAYVIAPGSYELDCEIFLREKLTIKQLIHQMNPEIILCYENFSKDYELFFDIMKYSKACGVRHFVFLLEMNFFRKAEEQISLLQMICKNQESDTFSPHIIKFSTLYGDVTVPSFIKELYGKIQQYNEIIIPNAETLYCDCLHIDDLCTFIGTLLEKEFDHVPMDVNLRSFYPFKFKSFIDRFCKDHPHVLCNRSIDIAENNDIIFYSMQDWTPKHNFILEISDVFEIMEQSARSDIKSHQVMITSYASRIVAFFTAFFSIEAYISFVPIASELQFVDFRILLIICTGLFIGKKNAILSAFLCSISSILHCLLSGTMWYVIFYHIDNWIPIAVYFVAAMLVGEFHEKHCFIRKKGKDLP